MNLTRQTSKKLAHVGGETDWNLRKNEISIERELS